MTRRSVKRPDVRLRRELEEYTLENVHETDHAPDDFKTEQGGTMQKNFEIAALGELLIDFTEAGVSASGQRLFEQNAGGAPANLLTAASHMGCRTAFIGKVVRILPIGAFVELAPGKDGMIHISKLENRRVEKVEDVLNIGDMTWVKVTEIDEKGRVNLSRKDALKELAAAADKK